MRTLMLSWTGLTGWMRMESGRSETMQVTDTALTVVATLLAAVTYAMLVNR